MAQKQTISLTLKATLKLISGIKIQSPSDKNARPTTAKVRESVLNILRGKIEGSNWLDICSGSGSMSCEALQSGANRILAVEMSKANAHICKRNLLYISEKLNKKNSTNIQVICNDVLPFLKKGCSKASLRYKEKFKNKDERFDFIYLDPPYKENIYERVFDFLLEGKWVKTSSILICECSPKMKPLKHNGWILKNQKTYGNCQLLFLTPNQASHYFYDIGSRH